MNFKHINKAIIGFFFISTTIFANANNVKTNSIKVVASFSILADIIKNIGKEKVKAVSIVGPNEDAHVFEPNPNHSRQILNADLVFINGLSFEIWFEKLAHSCKYNGKIINVSVGIKPIIISKHKELITYDPHVWNDVSNVIQWVKNIKCALQVHDAQNHQYYAKNAQEYIKKLLILDQHIKDILEQVKLHNKIIITSHDAFNYFAKAYKITFMSAQGISTESEPSAKEIANIIDIIKEKKITQIFVENISNKNIIEKICEETGAIIGGILYSDALSTTDEPAASYIELMYSNINNIVRAFV